MQRAMVLANSQVAAFFQIIYREFPHALLLIVWRGRGVVTIWTPRYCGLQEQSID